MHLSQGGPKNHSKTEHNAQLTRQMLVDNTTIIPHATDFNRLQIYEALLIRKHKPYINNQATGISRTLNL